MDAVLLFGENYLKISDFVFSQEDIANGNPYNCSFNLSVKSNSFCGIAPCEYDIEEFREFVREMDDLYSFKRTKVKLDDIGYGSTVTFEADKCGHIRLEGEIFGEAMQHALKFGFAADQTALVEFVNKLKLIIMI